MNVKEAYTPRTSQVKSQSNTNNLNKFHEDFPNNFDSFPCIDEVLEPRSISSVWGFQKESHKNAYVFHRLQSSNIWVVLFLFIAVVAVNAISIPKDPVIVFALKVPANFFYFVHVLHILVYKGFIPALKKPFRRFGPTFVCNASLVCSTCATLALIMTEAYNPSSDKEEVTLKLGIAFSIFMILVKICVFQCTLRVCDGSAYIISGMLSVMCIPMASLKVNMGPEFTIGTALFIAGAALVIQEYEDGKLSTFISLSNFVHSMRKSNESEQRKVLAESRTNELRYYIGNIAHDLKTPVQAIVTALDMLKSDLDSVIDDNHCRPTTSSSTLRTTSSKLTHARSSVTFLQNLCLFMTSMINRSLDFVKSESGVPLVATRQTLNIRKTVDFVIACVVSVSQTNVPIVLEPIPLNMSEYIITDQEWLQENLLCLISNAGKFTTTGSVNLQIELISTEELEQRCEASVFKYRMNSSARKDSASIPPFPTSPSSPSSRDARPCMSGSQDAAATERSSDIVATGGGDIDTDAVEQRSAPGPVESSMILFEVEDSGIGLSEEQMQGLFQPFKQAQRKAGGTGLGLFALAKRIEVAGGCFGVRKRRDGLSGCLFWFAIPYIPDDVIGDFELPGSVSEPKSPQTTQMTTTSPQHNGQQRSSADDANISTGEEERNESPLIESSVAAVATSESSNTTNTNNSSESTANAHPRPRVLLIEDSPLIQKTTARALVQAGYDVEVASNGVEGLDVITKARTEQRLFDVILLDIQMPVMDGIEMITRLRAVERSASSPSNRPQFVIGVSASSDYETRAIGMEAGMNDFIMKPMTIKAMIECCVQHGVDVP